MTVLRATAESCANHIREAAVAVLAEAPARGDGLWTIGRVERAKLRYRSRVAKNRCVVVIAIDLWRKAYAAGWTGVNETPLGWPYRDKP